MTAEEIRRMPATELAETLTELTPSPEALSFLAALISSAESYECVRELRRRFIATRAFGAPGTQQTHPLGAETVEIDPERFRRFLAMHRLSLVAAGKLANRSQGWGSVSVHRGKTSYESLDRLACALSMHVDDLILQVASTRELERLELVR